jgi:hypothetical protein
MSKKPKQTSYVRAFVGSVTLNGKVIASVDYEQRWFDDGTCETRGTPPADAFGEALRKLSAAAAGRKPKRTKRPRK